MLNLIFPIFPLLPPPLPWLISTVLSSIKLGQMTELDLLIYSLLTYLLASSLLFRGLNLHTTAIFPPPTSIFSFFPVVGFAAGLAGGFFFSLTSSFYPKNESTKAQKVLKIPKNHQFPRLLYCPLTGLVFFFGDWSLAKKRWGKESQLLTLGPVHFKLYKSLMF